MSHDPQSIIDLAWEGRAALNPTNAGPPIREAVEQTIADLNAGRHGRSAVFRVRIDLRDADPVTIER